MTLDRCLDEIGWSEKAALQGKLIDGRYHGLGVGCYFEGGASGPRENARLELETDGSVSVYVGSSSVGQGVETVFAQIAADALEVPIDRIRGVFHGSTGYVQRRLRLLQLALDRDGRLGDHRGRGHQSAATRSATPRPSGSTVAADDVSLDGDRAIGPGNVAVA